MIGATYEVSESEAEVAVLGSMILSPEAASRCIELLAPDDFSRSAHADVFRAMAALCDKRNGIDVTTLREELQRLGLLERVGGTSFLSRIMASVPVAANAEFYARIVLDHSRRRAIRDAARRMTELATDPGEKTTAEVLAESRGMLDAIEDGTERKPVAMADILASVFDSLDGKHEREGSVRTHLPGYNMDFGPLMPGTMTVLAARPSMGKTSLALQIAVGAACDGKHVLFFSMEMDREQIVRNLLCQTGHIDSGHLAPGRVLPDAAYDGLSAAVTSLTGADLVLDDTPALDPHALRARCLRHKSERGLDFVVIDYLGLMDTSAIRSKNSTRENEVGWLSRQIKALAKELRVPILVLSQLNRESTRRTTGRPALSDLRDSGCVEQDADVVLLLHREEMTVTDPDARAAIKGQAELLIAKNRNGPTGMFPLHFNGQWFEFVEDTTRSVVR